MTLNEKTYEQKLLSSKISMISFSLAVVSYGLVIFALLVRSSFQVLVEIIPLIVFCFLVTSLVLSIVDLRRKNRKKTFSIIALILSGLYFLLIIVAIAILSLVGIAGKA